LRQYLICLTASVAALAFPGMSHAQGSNVAASYEPAYFTQFQPNTARDMVGRIPGFVLQGGGNGERGFGQASLNILINGARPSSKSSDAGDILGRIPADTVERIDIVDGTSLDIPGLSGQVANIITSSEDGKLSGSWEYNARFEEGTEPQVLEGELSVSGTRGNLAFVASVDIGQFTFSEIGEEQFFDGAGNLFEDRIEDIYFAGNRPEVDLNLTWTPDNGHIANLNLSAGLWNRRNGARETFQAIIAPRGRTGQSIADNGEDEYNYEIGGDYEFGLGDGKLKLIGLHRFEDSKFDNRFQFFEDGEAPFDSRFDRFDDEGEYILRGEYSWVPKEGHDWQVSWEGAFNFLDSTTEFSDTNTDVITENVRVEEKRTEANITHSRALSDTINIQASLGAEYSELDVTTSSSPAGKFFRPKGFLSASYDISDKHRWRARIERDVGQLNFNTFVSSVNFVENTSSTGSFTVPTQFWNGEIELERKSGGAISGTAKVFARLIQDPIDRILFVNDPDDPDDDTEGPGNLDSAWRLGVEGNMTWLLDDIIAKGMRLELEGLLQTSSIEDPVTLVNRQINDSFKWRYEIGLSHDIPNSNWAWGVDLEHFQQATFFRRDQSFEAKFANPFNIVRVTHKDVFGMRLDVFFQNFLDFNVQQERLIYSPDRSGELVERQFFSRKRGKRVGFEISDTF